MIEVVSDSIERNSYLPFDDYSFDALQADCIRINF